MVTFKSDIDVTLVQKMGGDHMVVAAARVSTEGSEAEKYADPACAEENAGLINYLMKHRHGTPFEHAAMTFFVHAPIFVWREWHRHRIGFSYNEESARYKKLDPVFYLPSYDRPMIKVEEWKPGRPKFVNLDDINKYKKFILMKKRSYETAYESYEWALDNGFDPGVARIDLGVGIFSGCWVTCNPRSIMAFLSLRTHDPEAIKVSYPLWEIEEAAKHCEHIFKSYWPITYKAFNENGRMAP